MSAEYTDGIADAEAKSVPTKAIAKVDDKPPPKPTAIATAKNLDELSLAEAAKALMVSGLVKTGDDVGKLMAKLDLGRSLGLPTVTSINGLHLLNNGVVMSAAVMRLLLNRWSHKYKAVVRQRDVKGASIEFFVKEDGDWTSMGVPIVFGPDDAKRAGLDTKENYRKWPADMFYARAIAAGFRTYVPDCAGGVAAYLPDEIPDSGYKTDPTSGEMIPEAEYEVQSKKATKVKATTTPLTPPPESTVDRLRKLMVATKTEEAAITKHYAVAAFDALTESQMAAAAKLLEQKARSPVKS
jgi:hypothetical protein